MQNLTGRAGSGQEMFETGRIGSDRVRSFSNLTGRVGSGHLHPNPTRPNPRILPKNEFGAGEKIRQEAAVLVHDGWRHRRIVLLIVIVIN